MSAPSPPADPPPPAAGTPQDQTETDVTPPARPARVRFADLAGGAVEVEVEHAGQVYRLRRTRQGKLLLTK